MTCPQSHSEGGVELALKARPGQLPVQAPNQRIMLELLHAIAAKAPSVGLSQSHHLTNEKTEAPKGECLAQGHTKRSNQGLGWTPDLHPWPCFQ